MSKGPGVRRLAGGIAAIAALGTIAAAAPLTATARTPVPPGGSSTPKLHQMELTPPFSPGTKYIQICGENQDVNPSTGDYDYVCSHELAAPSSGDFQIPNWWWQGDVTTHEWNAAGAEVTGSCQPVIVNSSWEKCTGDVAPYPSAPATNNESSGSPLPAKRSSLIGSNQFNKVNAHVYWHGARALVSGGEWARGGGSTVCYLAFHDNMKSPVGGAQCRFVKGNKRRGFQFSLESQSGTTINRVEAFSVPSGFSPTPENPFGDPVASATS